MTSDSPPAPAPELRPSWDVTCSRKGILESGRTAPERPTYKGSRMHLHRGERLPNRSRADIIFMLSHSRLLLSRPTSCPPRSPPPPTSPLYSPPPLPSRPSVAAARSSPRTYRHSHVLARNQASIVARSRGIEGTGDIAHRWSWSPKGNCCGRASQQRMDGRFPRVRAEPR
jgi:hypothetical protein